MRKMQGKGRAKRWARRKASKRRQSKKPPKLTGSKVSAMRKQAGKVYDAINGGDSFTKQWSDAYAAGGPHKLSPKAAGALDTMMRAGEEAFRQAPPKSHFND